MSTHDTILLLSITATVCAGVALALDTFRCWVKTRRSRRITARLLES